MASYAINENFLQQLETLELILKNNVAGLFGGNHQSKKFGSSCEFADHREYMAGDDITKINWNLYARTENLYLKQYLDERRLKTKIYLDASLSMDFNKSNKAVLALQIAAAFAYLSIVLMDKASIYIIKDNMCYEVIHEMANKDSFYTDIMKLNTIEFSGDFKFSEAIMKEDVGYGDGLSIIISDFLTENDYQVGLDRLVDKKRDVLCVQLLSKEEVKPTIRGKIHYFDSELSSSDYRKNVNKDVYKAYLEAVNYVKNNLKNLCASRGANYVFMQDDKNIKDTFINMFIEEGVLK